MKKLLIGLTLGIASINSYALDMFNFDLFSKPDTTNCEKVNDHQVCNLYLLEGIGEPSTYLSVYKTLLGLKEGDIAYLHLAGMGGSGDGLVYLLNTIRNSRADVISVVDGSVASAHAVLAVATKKTIINGDAWILFHSISLSNMEDEVCRQETGSDRGLAAYTKCMELVPTLSKFYNKVIQQYVYPVMTPEEVKRYEEGHDIVITSDDLEQRLKVRDR